MSGHTLDHADANDPANSTIEARIGRVATDHLPLMQVHMNALVADIADRRRAGEMSFGEAASLIVVYRGLQTKVACERIRRERSEPHATLRPARAGLFVVVIGPADLEPGR